MSTLVDIEVLRPADPLGDDIDGRGERGGFLDCRGVWHDWSEDD